MQYNTIQHTTIGMHLKLHLLEAFCVANLKSISILLCVYMLINNNTSKK